MITVVVGIETTLGAHYTFPDMEKSIFEMVLAQDESWLRLGSLALTNTSGACLVLPTRIIQKVTVDGEIRWKAYPA